MIATYWLTVFHLASREAGTIDAHAAATARSPVTASSRPMITTTIQASILSIVQQRHQRRRHQQLVGDGIEQRAEGGHLVAPPRDDAVEPVGEGRRA